MPRLPAGLLSRTDNLLALAPSKEIDRIATDWRLRAGNGYARVTATPRSTASVNLGELTHDRQQQRDGELRHSVGAARQLASSHRPGRQQAAQRNFSDQVTRPTGGAAVILRGLRHGSRQLCAWGGSARGVNGPESWPGNEEKGSEIENGSHCRGEIDSCV
jgi:hypothetical protein